MSNNQDGVGSAGSRTVTIVACRAISRGADLTNVCSAILSHCIKNNINAVNFPAMEKIKVIVDGPNYDEKQHRSVGSDLVTSGGCPSAAQENLDEGRLPLTAWSTAEMIQGLALIKKASARTAKQIIDSTGGSIRLALRCCKENGGLDEEQLKKLRFWINGIVTVHANEQTVRVAYESTKLSSDKNSLDRLRSMFAQEMEDLPFFFSKLCSSCHRRSLRVCSGRS